MQDVRYLSCESLQQQHVINGDFLIDWISVSHKIQLRTALGNYSYCVTLPSFEYSGIYPHILGKYDFRYTFVYVYMIKFSLFTPWTRKWNGGKVPPILTSALDGDGWLPTHTSQFIPGREPRHPLNKRIWVTLDRSDGLSEGKTCCAYWKSYPRPSSA